MWVQYGLLPTLSLLSLHRLPAFRSPHPTYTLKTQSASRSFSPLSATPSHLSPWPPRCWCPSSSVGRILRCLCALVSWHCCMVSLFDGARPARHAWVCEFWCPPPDVISWVPFVPWLRLLLAVSLNCVLQGALDQKKNQVMQQFPAAT